jgi:hypothetical protein
VEKPRRDGAARAVSTESLEPAMTIHDLQANVHLLLLARLGDVFDQSLDTWFKIAAIAILWVYVIVGTGRESSES